MATYKLSRAYNKIYSYMLFLFVLSQSYIKRFVWYDLYDSQSLFRFSLLLHYHTSCSYRVSKSCSYRLFTEAVVCRCSVKKVFLKMSQNSQENTCARVPFLIHLQMSGLQLYWSVFSLQVFKKYHSRTSCSVWNLGIKEEKNSDFMKLCLQNCS